MNISLLFVFYIQLKIVRQSLPFCRTEIRRKQMRAEKKEISVYICNTWNLNKLIMLMNVIRVGCQQNDLSWRLNLPRFFVIYL